jgi:disulfide bond formation protein DsbB
MTTRTANALGFLVCAALIGFAYYAQFQLHLEPCPLCIFQRVGIFAVGVLFLIAALHGPRGAGRAVYAGLVLLAAAATAAVSVRQLWIQSQPPGTVAGCGASLDFMLKVLPLQDVLMKVLNGSGECAKVDWRLLGLAMPAWVLIAAVALAAWAAWAAWGVRARGGRASRPAAPSWR